MAEYEWGETAKALQTRYGIGGDHTIHRWVEQYEQEGLRHKLMRIQHPEEQDRVKELEARPLSAVLALLVIAVTIVGVAAGGWLFAVFQPLVEQGIVPLTVVAVVLSNLISNVPAVLLFRPFVPGFSHPTQTWLTLAMATTLAGNMTLLSSVANLIGGQSDRWPI